MVLSWKENQKCILELVLESTYKLLDSADILVLVSVEVLLKAECPLKSFGLEDKESLEDSWRSTELLKKSIVLSITNFILPQRVTNSRIEQSWLKPFSSKKARKLRMINWKLNNKLEDKRIKKEEKREQKNNKDCD